MAHHLIYFCKLVLLILSSTSLAHSDPYTDFNRDLTGETIPKLRNNQIDNAQDLDLQINKLLTSQKYSGESNRLILNRSLNRCEPSVEGSALIIAFSGTGSYQPRMPILMDQVCKSLGNSIKSDLLKNIHYRVHSKFYIDNPQLTNKWSGLLSGPMNFLCNNPDLLPNSYNWYSFPSEETELLDDPTKLSIKEFIKLPNEIRASFDSIPAGIRNAMQCTSKFLNNRDSKVGQTKLIVLSHSSGGRSAIKYLEKLKDLYNPLTERKGIRADLVFTIDPVREAHEAIAEALSQMAANPFKKAFNFLPVIPDVKVHPVYVWSRNQSESLYKTSNTLRHVNFYQKADQLGLKTNPKFGIHGSPISNADINHDLSDKLGDDGHGAITYHVDLIKQFEKELSTLYQ